MSKAVSTLAALAAALAAGGCAMLEPALPEANPGIPAQWTGTATPPAAGAMPLAGVAAVGWRDFFVDPKLAQLIAKALETNRDLRVAVLNVERARALYRIQRADRVPSVDVAERLCAPTETPAE